MKPLFSILLILSYLSGSLGVKLNQHFCCGELVGTEIVTQLSQDLFDTEQAGEESSGCCSDKVVTLKVDDGKTVFQWFQAEKSFSSVAVLPYLNAFLSPIAVSFPHLSESGKTPPEIPKPPLYLIFRSLLI